MVFVVVTGLLLMFTITVGWYVSNGVTASIAAGYMAQLTSSSGGAQITSLVLFANAWWGPIFDAIVVLWMFASAQAKDVESEMYG
jgi:hypothetical protein